MPFVITVDQRDSSTSPDRVDAALRLLGGLDLHPLLPFERTVGDEFQGVLGSALSVVDATLALVRDGHWHIGIGAGPVQRPLPASTRSARGPAFEAARAAVDAAKRRPQHLAVRGWTGPTPGPVPDDPADRTAGDPANQADAVLTLMAATVQRRSDPAWQAIDLVTHGADLAEAGRRLGVSRQAVGQRLAVGLWRQLDAVRPVAARLLTEAAGSQGDAR